MSSALIGDLGGNTALLTLSPRCSVFPLPEEENAVLVPTENSKFGAGEHNTWIGSF